MSNNQNQFLPKIVPESEDAEKYFFTHYLKQSSPEILISDDFIWTHIARCGDTYDTIDTSAITYADSLLRILVDEQSMMSDPVDVSMFPSNTEYAYKLPNPYLIRRNTRIKLDGATGLSNLIFALQGYKMRLHPTSRQDYIPYFWIGKMAYNIDFDNIAHPAWMHGWITKVHTLRRHQVEGEDDAIYKNINSAGDLGIDAVKVEYNNEQCFTADKTDTDRWSGTREIPKKLPAASNLMPGVSISVYTNTISSVGTDTTRWVILGGVYRRV